MRPLVTGAWGQLVMAVTHSIEPDDLRVAALVDEGLDGYILGPVQHRFVYLATQVPFRPNLKSHAQQGFTAAYTCAHDDRWVMARHHRRGSQMAW